MVRFRGRLQRDGDGAPRPVPGGSLQLLLAQVLPEDGPAAGRPAHLQDRLHTLAELHTQGHQARQLPHGPGQEGQPSLHNRLRPGEEVQGRQDAPAHTVQRE